MYTDQVIMQSVALDGQSVAQLDRTTRGTRERSIVLHEKLPGTDVTLRQSAGQISEVLNFAFKLHKYARYIIEGIGNPTFFLTTDMIIRMWHHEARSYLSATDTKLGSKAYLHQSEDGAIDNEAALSRANSLWQLEACVPMTGSVVEWNGYYRLRHTMTLKYLKVGKPISSNDCFMVSPLGLEGC